MLCLPVFINRTCPALLLLSLMYFLGMDLLLYFRTQNYDVRPRMNDTQGGAPYHSPILCEMNPICIVTVKAMMLDHPNHFVLSPLASLTDHLLGISKCWTWLSPNAISAFHVLVAVIGARYITRSSLAHRRLGVFLFQVRAWLDNLDGHVARKRRNVEGERSDVGSIGYLVDGLCDGLGCIALVVSVFFLLKRNSNRRVGYERLPLSHKSASALASQHDNGTSSLKTSFWKSPLYCMLLVGVHFLMTSAAWNRYISVYQDLLETDDRPPLVTKEQFYARQTVVFRSPLFWMVSLAWKIFNFHAAMDYMQLAIFFDRVWEYIRLVRWPAYVILLLLMFVSELHYLHVYTYVQTIPPVANVYTFLTNTIAAR